MSGDGVPGRIRRLCPTLAVSAAYLAGWIGLVGPGVVLHPSLLVVGSQGGNDYQVGVWSLAWWPHALTSLQNPFWTSQVWAPTPYPVAWMTSLPVPSLLAAPITLLLGPQASYNLLMLGAVTAAGTSVYLLCHDLTARFWPSAVAGAVFSFSPYMLGHVASQHLNLVLVFPAVLIARELVLHRLSRRTTRGAAVRIAAWVVVLVGSSVEVAAISSMLGAIVLALLWFVDRQARSSCLVGVRGWLCGVALSSPVSIAVLVSAHPALAFRPSGYAVDLVNVVVPTITTLIGGSIHAVRQIEATLGGNLGEQTGYVGIPLLLVAGIGVARVRRVGVVVALLLATVSFILSLGPFATIEGAQRLPVPVALSHLPIVSAALPDRLSAFTMLALVVLMAYALASIRRPPLALVGAAVIVGSLLPNGGSLTRWPGADNGRTPWGWTASTLESPVRQARFAPVLAHHMTVLVLPYGSATPAMAWQAQARFGFSLAGAYTPAIPDPFANEPIVRSFLSGTPGPLGVERLRRFLTLHHVGAVLLYGDDRSAWNGVLRTATGAAPRALPGDGTITFVPASLAPSDHRRTTPALAAAAGTVVAGWLRDANAGAVAEATIVRARNASASTVSAPLHDASSLQVAAGVGVGAVAFLQSTATTTEAAVAIDRGDGFVRTVVSDAGWTAADVRVVVDRNGVVLVATTEWDGPSSRLVVTALTTRAVSSSFTTSTGSPAGPRLVSARGKVRLAWLTTAAHQARVMLAERSGDRWTAPRVVAESVEASFRSLTVAADGSAISWIAVNPLEPPRLVVQPVGSGEAAWSTPIEPSLPITEISLARVAEGLIVVWNDLAGSYGQVIDTTGAATRLALGTGPMATTRLERQDGAVWLTTRAPDQSLTSRALDRPGWPVLVRRASGGLFVISGSTMTSIAQGDPTGPVQFVAEEAPR